MADALLAYLNGEYLPRDRACVPVTDRGLLFGDSVYEVVPAYGGIPFRVTHHLNRLDRSLDAIRMQNPLGHDAWRAVFSRLTQQLPGQDQSIYLQVTRGAYPVRNHVIPAQTTPTVFAFTSPNPPPGWYNPCVARLSSGAAGSFSRRSQSTSKVLGS